ncbi:Sperm associated antigen 1 [Rhizophlyctis rosea]|uniref:Sperm associated antigen 1 n=1 Tax=Rhizophlyctis rosea TaxID=64517 RepID=A0AAD5S6V5_9FUNG|nr:Sperm associated antigen 1 [Rhizophlyctis rosea]
MLSTKDLSNVRQFMGDQIAAGLETEPIGDYDVSHLDYSYVATCNDVKELSLLLSVLRSGKEGIYPELEDAIERRMDEVDPRRDRKMKPADARHPVSDAQLVDEFKVMAFTRVSANSNRRVNVQILRLFPTQQLSADLKQKDSSLRTTPRTTQPKPSTTPPTSKILLQTEELPSPQLVIPNTATVPKPIELTTTKTKKQVDATRIMKPKPLISTDIKPPTNATSEEIDYLAENEKRKGNEAFRSEDYEEAIQYYTRSLHLHPTPNLYTNLSLTHLKLSQYLLSEQAASEALSFPSPILTPNLEYKAYHRRAVARSKRGKYVEAKGDCEMALRVWAELGEAERRAVVTLMEECGRKCAELGGGVGEGKKEREEKERKRILIEEVDGEKEDEEGEEEKKQEKEGVADRVKEVQSPASNKGRIQIMEVEDDEDEDDD